MTEWWTYRLTDFLLFSPRVYHRLFEQQNLAWWPLHLGMIGLGLWMAWRFAVRARDQSNPAFLALGLVWIWIAWAFLWERYATINWTALYIIPVFVLQGFLLAWLALRKQPSLAVVRPARMPRGPIALLLFAVAGYPFIAALSGRPWLQASVFGIAPDPTALATLAACAAAGRGYLIAAVVPAVWCMISGLTLFTMGSPEFFVPPVGALAALVCAAIRKWTTS